MGPCPQDPSHIVAYAQNMKFLFNKPGWLPHLQLEIHSLPFLDKLHIFHISSLFSPSPHCRLG